MPQNLWAQTMVFSVMHSGAMSVNLTFLHFCFARQDIKYRTFAGQQFHCAEIRLQESPQVSGRILSDLTYNRLWLKSDELVEDQPVGSAGAEKHRGLERPVYVDKTLADLEFLPAIRKALPEGEFYFRSSGPEFSLPLDYHRMYRTFNGIHLRSHRGRSQLPIVAPPRPSSSEPTVSGAANLRRHTAPCAARRSHRRHSCR